MKTPAFAGTILLMSPMPLLAQEAGGGLVTVDMGFAILAIVVFGLVLLILGKFAWGPILSAMDAREQGIRDSIESAATMRQEAEAALEEHRKQLAEARKESQQIIADGRSAAERIRRDIEGKAKAEADRILDRTRQEIDRERDRALEQVREEAVDLAMAAAARILSEKLTEERDRKMVQGYLEEIRPTRVEA